MVDEIPGNSGSPEIRRKPDLNKIGDVGGILIPVDCREIDRGIVLKDQEGGPVEARGGFLA